MPLKRISALIEIVGLTVGCSAGSPDTKVLSDPSRQVDIHRSDPNTPAAPPGPAATAPAPGRVATDAPVPPCADLPPLPSPKPKTIEGRRDFPMPESVCDTLAKPAPKQALKLLADMVIPDEEVIREQYWAALAAVNEEQSPCTFTYFKTVSYTFEKSSATALKARRAGFGDRFHDHVAALDKCIAKEPQGTTVCVIGVTSLISAGSDDPALIEQEELLNETVGGERAAAMIGRLKGSGGVTIVNANNVANAKACHAPKASAWCNAFIKFRAEHAEEDQVPLEVAELHQAVCIYAVRANGGDNHGS